MIDRRSSSSGLTPSCSPPPSSRRTVTTVAILAFTQLVGWGTTFDMMGVLGRVIAADLGFANEFAFLGISVMMVAGAVAGPLVGRGLNRHGAAPLLSGGSLALGLGILLLSAARGPVLYMLAWCVIGFASAFAMTAPAFTAIVEREGARAGRIIGILMLFTGLSSAIFWPLLSAVSDLIGWRHTFVVTGCVHLAVCLPLHLFCLPKRGATEAGGGDDGIVPVALDGRGKRRAFLLIAASTLLVSVVTYGLTPSLLPILTLSGASPALALQLGSLRGVMGISARFIELLVGRRGSPLISTLIGTVMLTGGFVMLAFSAQSPPLLVAFIVTYGFSSGLVTVARAVLPLMLFSRGEYGLLAARLSVPQNLASAAAPMIFTGILDRLGLGAVVATVLIMSCLALLMTVALWVQVRWGQRS